MARVKLSEYKAKSLFLPVLGAPFGSIHVDISSIDSVKTIDHLDKTKSYVVKVDQGIKKRMKQGLMSIDVNPYKIRKMLEAFIEKGYSQFFIEEFVPHESVHEKYLSLERTREGIMCYYSNQGGIDIESHQESVKNSLFRYDGRGSSDDVKRVVKELGIPSACIPTLLEKMNEWHVSFLEINPLVVNEKGVFLLDLAVEVDSAGEFFVNGAWSRDDFVVEKRELTKEEKTVVELGSTSQASFNLTVLHPDGALFLLLSGGGASIVLADEAYNQGYGKLVANYGEYSGNPNQEETYIYTKQVLSLLLASKAPQKALIIGGGVANFTDIRKTFLGAVQALTQVAPQLRKQRVKVFVRRGGPHQEVGLANMRAFLEMEELFGGVWDQSMILSDVIDKALQYVRH